MKYKGKREKEEKREKKEERGNFLGTQIKQRTFKVMRNSTLIQHHVLFMVKLTETTYHCICKSFFCRCN